MKQGSNSSSNLGIPKQAGNLQSKSCFQVLLDPQTKVSKDLASSPASQRGPAHFPVHSLLLTMPLALKAMQSMPKIYDLE